MTRPHHHAGHHHTEVHHIARDILTNWQDYEIETVLVRGAGSIPSGYVRRRSGPDDEWTTWYLPLPDRCTIEEMQRMIQDGYWPYGYEETAP